MTEPKTPETPKTPDPIEIIEFVDRLPAWAVIAAVLTGMVIGAAVLYVAISLVVEDPVDA